MSSDSITGSSESVSVFGRAETVLAHGVYGLILTLATLGELLNHHSSASESAGLLLGAGAVLLAAHVFSDVLAKTTATRSDLSWSRVFGVGREEIAVTYGFVGAALIMAVAEVADLDVESALGFSIAVGLLSVAGLSFYATAHHGPLVRVFAGATAAVLGAVIVTLENTL
jgi:hypothetical protein